MTSTSVRVPVHARAIRTRRRLVEAAEQEFSARGYAATTARTITQRAGAATGSFYQYFSDKDALLRELASARQARLIERLTRLYSDLQLTTENVPADAQLHERLREMVTVVVDYHSEAPALHAVITERRNADAELTALLTRGEQAVVQSICGLLERWSAHDDPLAVAFVLYGMVEGSVHAHVLGERMVSNGRFITALVEATTRVAFPIPVSSPQAGTRRSGSTKARQASR